MQSHCIEIESGKKRSLKKGTESNTYSIALLTVMGWNVRETYVPIVCCFLICRKGTFFILLSSDHRYNLYFSNALTSSCYSSNVNFLWSSIIKLRSVRLFRVKHSARHLMFRSNDFGKIYNREKKMNSMSFVIILRIFVIHARRALIAK